MRMLLTNALSLGWSAEAERLKDKLKRLKERLAASEYHRRKQALIMMFACCQMNNQRVAFRDLLSLEGLHRRDRRLPRGCLNAPNMSAWQAVYNSLNDQAYITVTGFDVAGFNELLGKFAPLFKAYTPWTGENDGATFSPVNQTKKGRPRMVTAASCLGLTLAYFRFKGAEFALQGWFGFTGTHANVWLRFGKRMLLRALWRDARCESARHAPF